MASTSKSAAEAADDLDDLDDILDEFNNTPSTSTAGASTSATGASAATASVPPATTQQAAATSAGPASLENGDEDEDELSARFAQELAQGMEALMRGMNPDATAAAAGGSAAATSGAGGSTAKDASTATAGEDGDGSNGFDEEQMMKQFEQMMADMGLGNMAGGAGAGPSMPSTSATGAGGSSQGRAGPQQPANFQDAIKNTMSRLRESDASAKNDASSANEMDFEKLLAAMGNADGGEGGEEGIANMLENMMNELMSKEVLYEPLKELRDKYPGYLANTPAGVSAEDRARYEKQYEVVKQVVAAFDDPKFDTGTEAEKKARKENVQNLMNEMQDNGAPPPEIVGDLPPELENLPGMGGNDENCTIM